MFVVDICFYNRMFTVRSRAVSCCSTSKEAGMLKILHGPCVCRERESGRPPKHVRARPSRLALVLIDLPCIGRLLSSEIFVAITARWTLEFGLSWYIRVSHLNFIYRSLRSDKRSRSLRRKFHKMVLQPRIANLRTIRIRWLQSEWQQLSDRNCLPPTMLTARSKKRFVSFTYCYRFLYKH